LEILRSRRWAASLVGKSCDQWLFPLCALVLRLCEARGKRGYGGRRVPPAYRKTYLKRKRGVRTTFSYPRTLGDLPSPVPTDLAAHAASRDPSLEDHPNFQAGAPTAINSARSVVKSKFDTLVSLSVGRRHRLEGRNETRSDRLAANRKCPRWVKSGPPGPSATCPLSRP